MDNSVDQEALAAAVREWKNHPLTREVLHSIEDHKKGILVQVLNDTPNSLAEFVQHFRNIGTYSGLCQFQALVEEAEDNVKQLKD